MFRAIAQAYQLLSRKCRLRWIAVALNAVVSAMLELVVAALLVWTVGMLTGQERPHAVAAFLPSMPVTAVAGLFAGVLLLKNALLAVGVRLQSRAVTASQAEVFGRLVSRTLAAPYSYHLKRRPSHVVQDAMTGTDVTYRLVLGSAVGLASEVMTAVALAVMLLATVPVPAMLILALLALILGGTIVLTRRHVARWGEEVHVSGEKVLDRLTETLSSIKDVKASRTEAYFAGEAIEEFERLADASRRHLSLLSMPRVVAETVFVAVAFVLLAMFMRTGGEIAAVLPMLGLFAYTGFRMIPAATRVLYHLDHIRHRQFTVVQLAAAFRELDELPRVEEQRHTAHEPHQTIVVDGVSYRHGTAEKISLQGASLTIARGERIGLSGPSGSGKTTLLDLIAGLLEPQEGSVTVDGVPAHQWMRDAGSAFAYVPQSPSILDASLPANITFGETSHDHAERLDEAMIVAGLSRIGDRGVDELGHRGAKLSGGERQRVAIARAIYRRPEILLLDEPVTGLDETARNAVVAALASLQGTTIIVAAHDPESLLLCDRIVTIEEGTITSIVRAAR